MLPASRYHEAKAVRHKGALTRRQQRDGFSFTDLATTAEDGGLVGFREHIQLPLVGCDATHLHCEVVTAVTVLQREAHIVG